MRKRLLLAFLSCPLIFCWCACSGLPAGGGNPPGGNATLSIIMRAIPPSPSAHLSILSFRATVTGVSLTPSSGSPVSINLVTASSGTYIAELTRLQSDSALLSAAVPVPAGNYESIALTFSDVLLTFCTQPSPGTAGCASGSLSQVTASAATATARSGAFPLTVTTGEKLGLAVDVNVANAVSAVGQNISAVNFALPNVLTSMALPAPFSATDLSTGQLSHVDDLYGIVSNVSSSGQTFTLQTAFRGEVFLTASSSTTFDPICPANGFACVAAGGLAAVDAILNADGALTVRNFTPVPFAAVSQDTVEGVVIEPPSSVNQVFSVVVSDASFAQSSSLLRGAVHPGDLVSIGVVSPQPFFVVSKGLVTPANNFSGSTDVSSIQPGQAVAISVAGFSASNGKNAFASATARGVALRFSRVTGTVVTPTSPQFAATAFPPYFGFNTNPLVQITAAGANTTDFDGTSSFIETAADTVSVSALYFGPTNSPSFSAATIRKH